MAFLIAIFVVGEREGAKGLIALMNVLATLLLIFVILFVVRFIITFIKK